jgi:hypothetical protein
MGDAGPCSPFPAEFSSTSNDSRPGEVTVLVTGFGVCIGPNLTPSRQGNVGFHARRISWDVRVEGG